MLDYELRAHRGGPIAIGPTDQFAGPRANPIPSITRLDRSIKERYETDVKLVNWWLYALLLAWVTLGTYALYVLVKRITRIDSFSARKRDYYGALLEWTRRRSKSQGQIHLVHSELLELETKLERAYTETLAPIRAGRSLLLSLATLGLYGLFVIHRMNRYWSDAELLEQEFDDRLSRIWLKLGIVRVPIHYSRSPGKQRSFGKYLGLSFLTLGVWAAVWDYKLHTDPDSLYADLHRVEDSVLATVRIS
ncbi:MAG: DUF4234 domain-containing protein [Solirubrobacterales bacterium]|nr:DUF4234 domain-containing protein [Solirubrobacterales bacterium]